MDKISVIAITKNGINIGKRIKRAVPSCEILAPAKLSDGTTEITWYMESTTEKIASLFKDRSALVCIFSLGAVIRLIAPHMKSKKTDPAILVIDDKANFVISALSGHLGGANKLALEIASKLDSVPVITTAADVNRTISVDLLGREFGWKIDDETTITKISAHMVNGEKIGVFQDVGSTDWRRELPENVEMFDDIEEMKKSGARGFLVITDKLLRGDFLKDAVVYRPPSLVVGVGLHQNTSKETIINGIDACMEKFGLCIKSVYKLVSVKKPLDVLGLVDAGNELGIDVEYIDRDELAQVATPNPSDVVMALEGTSSVSEAAAIKISGGDLIVQKQKFPPDLTIAVARKKR